MIDLLPALQTAFAANAMLTAAFPGNGSSDRGFRVGEMPERLPLPYVVAHPIAAPRTLVYGNLNPTAADEVQFTVYGATLATALAACGTFITEWDGITLSIAGKTLSFDRYGEPVPLAAEKNEAGADVWAFAVTYKYFIRS